MPSRDEQDASKATQSLHSTDGGPQQLRQCHLQETQQQQKPCTKQGPRDPLPVSQSEDPQVQCLEVTDHDSQFHGDKDQLTQGDVQGEDGTNQAAINSSLLGESDIVEPEEDLLGEPAPDAPLVFMIGGPGLLRELQNAGLRVVGEEDSSATISAVLVGYDEDFTFRKLSRACTYLRDPNCLLVATDRDPWHLLSGGRCTPGTGSLVAAVETAAGRPAVVVGKPSLFMFEDILAHHNLDPARTLMVGDRIEVDIRFGRNCGLTSILTLTGVSQLTDVQDYAQSDQPAQRRLVPDFYVESIADLLPGLED